MNLHSFGGLRLALALLAAILLTGTLGYMGLEAWPAWDALYMTVTTVTTVGFREVHPLSLRGQVFTVVLVLGGVSVVLYTLSLLAARLVEGRLGQRFETRRRERMIDDLHEHFIVCGAGRIGRLVADRFRRERAPFVVIDRDPEAVHAMLAHGDIAVEADASREDVLVKLRIDRARGLIAALGSDAENVYAILTARGLRPDLLIIARADSEDAGRKLLRAGASRVVSPYQIGAQQMAQTALRPAVVDFVELATSSEHLELAMEQVRITERSPLAGQSLVQVNLRQRFGVIVVGIQHAGGQMEFNPAPDASMHAGDQLVVLGPPERLQALDATASPMA